jgi:flavin reductase (DIM6/NTAB) family NADH-FMN oxidoreductase RutF
MLLDFAALSPRNAYQWMTSTILPRPIAWVSTISPDGKTNLAPFSFFQGITANPPTLMFVPVNNREGAKKDTVRNIELVPEFVVNLVPHALAAAMNDTAALLPYGESEFSRFGVASAPSVRVKPPRVAESPVAFECVLDQIVHIGDGAPGRQRGLRPHRDGPHQGRCHRPWRPARRREARPRRPARRRGLHDDPGNLQPGAARPVTAARASDRSRRAS